MGSRYKWVPTRVPKYIFYYNFNNFLFYIYVFCYCYKQFTELYSCLAVVALFAAAFIVAACAGGIV